jgi:transcription elongation factor Elf1
MANVAVDTRVAVISPYSYTPIPLFLGSLTGMRYRTLHCLECGEEILERNNDTMYRLNDNELPTQVAISAESIKVKCGKCEQWYGVQVSVVVGTEPDGVPLYMQPQSLYIVSEPNKKLRYIHCLECGKSFQTISDRISHMVDNRIPFEFVDPTRLGPIESLCSFNRCGQAWSLMI